MFATTRTTPFIINILPTPTPHFIEESRAISATGATRSSTVQYPRGQRLRGPCISIAFSIGELQQESKKAGWHVDLHANAGRLRAAQSVCLRLTAAPATAAGRAARQPPNGPPPHPSPSPWSLPRVVNALYLLGAFSSYHCSEGSRRSTMSQSLVHFAHRV